MLGKSFFIPLFLIITCATSLFSNDLKLSIDKPGLQGKIFLEKAYPELENLDVDLIERRGEVKLNGDFPKLKTVNMKSTWGNLYSQLTGSFSSLDEASFEST